MCPRKSHKFRKKIVIFISAKGLIGQRYKLRILSRFEFFFLELYIFRVYTCTLPIFFFLAQYGLKQYISLHKYRSLRCYSQKKLIKFQHKSSLVLGIIFLTIFFRATKNILPCPKKILKTARTAIF